jgi:hypothetical protein
VRVSSLKNFLPNPVPNSGNSDANRERGQTASLLGFGYDGVQVGEDLSNRKSEELARGVEPFFNALFQVAAGNLDSELIGENFSAAVLLRGPGGAGKSYEDGFAIDVEADIDGVCMASGNGHKGAVPAARQGFAGKAIGDGKVFVHATSLSLAEPKGKWEASQRKVKSKIGKKQHRSPAGREGQQGKSQDKLKNADISTLAEAGPADENDGEAKHDHFNSDFRCCHSRRT